MRQELRTFTSPFGVGGFVEHWLGVCELERSESRVAFEKPRSAAVNGARTSTEIASVTAADLGPW